MNVESDLKMLNLIRGYINCLSNEQLYIFGDLLHDLFLEETLSRIGLDISKKKTEALMPYFYQS